MQVKIEVSRFVAVADLTGAELEVLQRAFSKMLVVEEKYCEAISSYVLVTQGVPKAPEIDMVTGTKLVRMTSEQFDTIKAAHQEKVAKIEAEQRAKRAVAFAEVVSSGTVKPLVDVLQEQTFLYYKEIVEGYVAAIDPDSIALSTSTNDGANYYTITVTSDGTVTRAKA
jgi:hypothetical protein